MLTITFAFPDAHGEEPPAAGRPIALGTPLEKHEVEYRTIQVTSSVGSLIPCECEQSIATDEATRVCERAERVRQGRILRLTKVPNRPGLWIFAVDSKTGLQLVLARLTEAWFAELDHTKGEGDSYNLQPVFFTGQGRIFTFAEVGTEYSWGYRVLEIKGNRFFDLGLLEVAVDDDDTRAIPHPSLRGHVLMVGFETDLTTPNGDVKLTRVGGRPIVFRHDGKRFVRVQ